MATLLNLPPPPRTPTSTNPSSPPATEESTSGPGTPASGISMLSTTAIKDGHEGHRPTINFDVAAERVARLGGLGPPSVTNPGYFDRERPIVNHGPSSVSNISTAGSDDRSTVDNDPANSTQAKRETMAAAIARRNMAASQLSPNANTSPTQQRPSGTGLPLTATSLSAIPNASDSPASGATTTTTPSVAEARRDAKMIDGMTYDEDIVDTTAEGIVRGETEAPGTLAEQNDTEMKDAETERNGN